MMLLRCTIFLLLCQCGQILAQIHGQSWSAPRAVGRGSAARLAVDTNSGHIHLNYIGYSGPYGSQGMRYARLGYHNGTFTVHEHEAVPGGESDHGYWLGGTAVAVDNGGQPHLLFRTHAGEFGRFNLFYTKKTASGWSLPQALKSDIYRAFSIDMAFDGSNGLHIGWCEKLDEWHDGFYARIEQGRLSGIKPGFNGTRWDNGLGIAVTDDADVHLVFGQPYSGNYPVTYYASQDGGQTFQHVDNVSVSSDQFVRAGHPDIALDENGIAHICYGSGKNTDLNVNSKIQYVQYQNGSKLLHATIASGGSGFGDLDESSYRWFISDIAVSSSGRDIAVVYCSMDKAGREYTFPGTGVTRSVGGSLYVRMSGDYGATWSEAVEFTDLCYLYDGRTQPYIEAVNEQFYTVYETLDSVYVRAFPAEALSSPVADAGGPYSGGEGQEIVLDAGASRPSAASGTVSEYAWDTDGDGVFDISTGSPQYAHIFPDDYSGQLILRVTDSYALTAFDTAEAVIVNLPPAVSAGSDTVLNAGDTLFRVADPEDVPADTVTCFWQIGARIFPGDTLRHQFLESGWYTVTVTARDDDGGETVDTALVTVRANPPAADAGGPYSGGEGQEVLLDASGSAASFLEAVISEYAWDVNGDGVFEISTETPQYVHVFPDDYHGPLVLKVTDNFSLSAFDTADAVIVNLPPVADAGGPYEGTAGSPVQFSAAASTDPGVHDTLAFLWDFSGDLTWDAAGEAPIWTWDTEGEKLVRLLVTDKDGAVDSAQVSVTIHGASAAGDDESVYVPEAFRLLQNYPNPFNPHTRISYHLPGPGRVFLAVYDPLGRQVRVLYDGMQAAGVHTAVFDGRTGSGSALPCGVYFYKLRWGYVTKVRKMLLLL